MTDLEIAIRVSRWQQTLAALGISHWDFEIDVQVDPVGGPFDDRIGAVTSLINDKYDRVEFTFDKESIPAVVNDEFDSYIVHEWLHVALRDYDKAIHAVSGMMGADAYRLWQDRLDHEEEGIVERLAQLIVSLYNPKDVVQ